MDPEKQYLVKLMLLGDTKVGKTSFYQRFCKGEFNEKVGPTIGVDFVSKQLEVDGKQVKVQIWDASGDASYKSLLYCYYKSQKGIIFLFDITDKETFKNIEGWREDVAKHLTELPQPKLSIVGAKLDLEENRQVQYEEAKAYAESIGALYIEASAKTNQNVDQAYTNILKVILDQEQTQ